MAGLNNWIKLSKSGEPFSCSLDFSNFKHINKNDAIDHTVHQLSKLDNLFVGFSGGIDSEFVVKCLHERGVPFTPVIVDFQINGAEVWYAYYWCKKHNVIPLIIKLSPGEMRNSFSQICDKYNTSFIGAVDFIIEEEVSKLDGHLIVGTCEPVPRDSCLEDKSLNQTEELVTMSSFDFAVDIAYPNKHPMSFFSYTPEMLYVIVNELDYNKSSQIALSEFYGVTPRPKIPYVYNLCMDFVLMDIGREMNAKHDLYSIEIDRKDSFLKRCLKQEIIECNLVKIRTQHGKIH